MTDRIHSFTVVLERDIRTDDAQDLQNALMKFRGVLDVQPAVADIGDHVARVRVRSEIAQRLLKVLDE